jgi:membrane associated rhomboid family serine protease
MFFPLRDDNPRGSFPAVTISIIVLNAAVFLYEQSLGDVGLQRLFLEAGAIPARFGGSIQLPPGVDPFPASATLISSMFMHGGWMHLLGNMWFLWIFGDNVEDYFGALLFPIFFVISGLGATAAHIAFDAGSAIPVVGASGAISGVLGAYAILYPKARVYTFVWIIIFFRTFYLPAFAFLGLWFVYQFMSMGQGGVAWWAHIGGFVAGGGIALAAKAGGRVPAQPRYFD